MLARCTTYVLDGIAAHPLTVECDIRPGLPSCTVLGLSDLAVRELRETVRAAILNCGYAFPQQRVTLNLAPARLRRTSPSVALAAAAAVLAAAGELPADRVAGVAVYGALTLAGAIAPLRGTLAAASAHRTSGRTEPLLHGGEPLPRGNLTPDGARAVAHLTDLAAPSSPHNRAKPSPPPVRSDSPSDYADVRVDGGVIFRLTVAAAGGHPVLLRGGAGSGATMLARRLVTILPELTAQEQQEVATIRDAAGLGVSLDRPFRAPHHTITPAGLVGGGSPLHPGEVTLAHRGVLFLSDLPEFSRASLEALRAPLDDGNVVVVRGDHATRFPANVQLVASASPCPCGHGATGRCLCDGETLDRYQRRLSASLLDRFAIIIDLPSGPDAEALPPAPSSAELRDRVRAARERRRMADATVGVDGSSAAESRAPALSGAARAALHDAYRAGSLTRRSGARLLAVARTVADLAGEDSVTDDSLNTALALGVRQGLRAPKLAR